VNLAARDIGISPHEQPDTEKIVSFTTISPWKLMFLKTNKTKHFLTLMMYTERARYWRSVF
jgi:hypothetical protein